MSFLKVIPLNMFHNILLVRERFLYSKFKKSTATSDGPICTKRGSRYSSLKFKFRFSFNFFKKLSANFAQGISTDGNNSKNILFVFYNA